MRWGGVAVFLCALAPAVPAAQDPSLTEQLGEVWRWREVFRGGSRPDFSLVRPWGGGAVVGAHARGATLYDGTRWTPLLSWPETPGDVRALAVGDGQVAVMRRSQVDWIREGAEPRRHELDGAVRSARMWILPEGPLVAVNEELVLVSESGAKDFLTSPAPGDRILGIARDRTGSVWCAVQDALYRHSDDGWQSVPLPPELERNIGYTRILPADDRVYFMEGTPMEQSNLVAWNGEELVVLGAPARTVLPAAAVGPSGELIAATTHSSLLIHDGSGWDEVGLASIVDEEIVSLTMTDAKRLVATTITGRLFTCNLASERWRFHDPRDVGLSQTVDAIAPSIRGGLWVGGPTGIARFEDGRFTDVHREGAGVELRAVTALREDELGHLWVGSGSGFRGALELAGDSWELHREEDGVGQSFVHRIRSGTSLELWFLMLGDSWNADDLGGIAVREQRRWRRYGPEDGLPHDRAYDVAFRTDGAVFAATLRGVVQLDGDVWRAFGEPSDECFALLATRDGTLWRGHGLMPQGVELACHDGRWLTPSAEFATVSAAEFAEDSQGRVWMAGRRGLHLWDGKYLHEASAEPGLPSRDFWPLEIGSDDGLFVGTVTSGLVELSPDDRSPPSMERVEFHRDETSGEWSAVWIAADAWGETPAERLRCRFRIDGGPWSAPTSATPVHLGSVDPGRHEVEFCVIDLSGNVSAHAKFDLDGGPSSLARVLPLAALGLAVSATAALVLLELRRRREQLEAAEKFRGIVETANEGVWMLDETLCTTYSNARIASMLGSTPGDLLGRSVRDFLDEESAEALDLELPRIRRGEPAQFSWRLERSSAAGGGRLDAVAGVSTVGDRLLVMVADVTALKETEEALQYAQKLESLGILAGGVAHDFNNLLVVVVGNAELALEKGRDAKVVPHLQKIRYAGQRAAELCEDMLAYAGRGVMEKCPVDLGQVFHGIERLLTISVPSRADVVREIPDGLPLVEGSETQLRQVLVNLVMNACDAVEEDGGHIRISAREVELDEADIAAIHHSAAIPPGRYVQVEVADDGLGMDEEIRARIFDPFYTTKATGRGLGLAAVIGIVRGHGGVIGVESEPGRGTTFRVYLPAMEERAVAALGPVADLTPDAWGSDGTALVIDDEAAVGLVAREFLESMGFRVLVAQTRRDAVELLRKSGGEIRVVLLDMTMPDANGVDVLEDIRHMGADARVIVVSGFDARENRERFSGRVRPEGYLKKPYSRAQLREKLRAVLAGN